MTQDRPNEHLVKTGDYFDDSIQNVVEILKREQREDTEQKLSYIKRLTDVLDDDVILIPKPPVITVSFVGWDEEIHTIGQRRPVTVEWDIELIIYYYHAEVKNKIRKREITKALWEISRILRRNSDLNGLSSKGATISRGEMMYRVRNNKLYEGGLIRMNVPVLDKTRRGTT